MGWVVIADGDFCAYTIQREALMSTVCGAMVKALESESTFSCDFYRGAFESSTGKAKAKALSDQQAFLAAERACVQHPKPKKCIYNYLLII